MLHTKFRGNRPAGSGEEDFLKGFYHKWCGSYLGHVTSIIFSFPCTKNLVQIGTVVSEKIWLEFLYVHDLGPRSRNDIDRQYSHTFIYSIRCLLLLTFRSLAAIVSEKSTDCFHFFK